jgi:hypothetical protein
MILMCSNREHIHYRVVHQGLNEGDFTTAATTALNRDTVDDRWLYFCGVCWTMVKQREEMAAAELHRPSDSGATSKKNDTQERMLNLINEMIPGGLDHNRGPCGVPECRACGGDGSLLRVSRDYPKVG